MSSQNFVSTAWLSAHLGALDLGLIDASWHLPPTGRNGAEEFLQRHIPGAVFFDIDVIADNSTGLPHMLPDSGQMAEQMSTLGLADSKHFVIYDSLGLFAAARVWWMLRAYGAREVKILEGGLPQWLAEGRATQSGQANPVRSKFTPRFDASFVIDLDELRALLASGAAQIVDARPAARYRGQAPEPRPGLKSGHIPGTLNLPFTEVVVAGKLRSGEDLRATFAKARIDLQRPIATTCGSGVTAAILALAVEEAGGTFVGLYDGSFAQWGSREDCPVKTGAS